VRGNLNPRDEAKPGKSPLPPFFKGGFPALDMQNDQNTGEG